MQHPFRFPQGHSHSKEPWQQLWLCSHLWTNTIAQAVPSSQSKSTHMVENTHSPSHPQTHTWPPTPLVFFRHRCTRHDRISPLRHSHTANLSHTQNQLALGRPTLGHTVFLRTGTPDPTVHPPHTPNSDKTHSPAHKVQTQVPVSLHRPVTRSYSHTENILQPHEGAWKCH